MNEILLDLGCGTAKRGGAIGIDITNYPGVDIVKNLDDPKLKLPYQDSTIDGIYCSHFLEHITNLYPLLNECHRVLKAVGFFDIIVPLAPSRSAFDDPSHVRFFTKGTFSYFSSNPPGNYTHHEQQGLWRIELNDWTPVIKEDVDHVWIEEMRELHVIMRPAKPMP